MLLHWSISVCIMSGGHTVCSCVCVLFLIVFILQNVTQNRFNGPFFYCERFERMLPCCVLADFAVEVGQL